jgi:hypothetical protein
MPESAHLIGQRPRRTARLSWQTRSTHTPTGCASANADAAPGLMVAGIPKPERPGLPSCYGCETASGQYIASVYAAMQQSHRIINALRQSVII